MEPVLIDKVNRIDTNRSNLKTFAIFSVSMSTIICQVQEAFRFLRHRFPFTNGFHVMGHSAGAHLATMIMAQPAHDFPELLPITLYPVSGIFDLRFVRFIHLK